MIGSAQPALLQRFWELAGGVSVRTKIFGIVLGSTILLSLAFTWQVRAALFNALENDAQGQGVSIARDVAARATDLILINDLYALQQLLLETRSNFEAVRYAFVVDERGQVLAHTFGAGFPPGLLEANTVAPQAYQNTAVLETETGLVWDVAVPIFEGRAGTARIGLSDERMRNTLSLLTTQMALTVIAVVTFSLLASTFLTWILTRPILGLVDASQAIARGDFSPRVRRWANDEIGDLAEAFNHMAAELGRTDELRQEREQLRRQLLEGVITAQEEERRRIARELHDGTSQSLTSLMVGLRTLEAHCENPEIHEHAAQLRQVVGDTLEDVHALALQLRPSVLDDLGLAAALERLVGEWQSRHGVQADLAVHLGAERLAGSTETALYRIVQEALTNVARHASAKSVSVLVERRQNDVVAVVEDDGQGFELGQSPGDGHLGLLGVRERAALLGGDLTIESDRGRGTSIFVRIPQRTETALAGGPEHE